MVTYYYDQAKSIAFTFGYLKEEDPNTATAKHTTDLEEPESRLKRARKARQALQRSNQRMNEKVKEAKASAIESTIQLTQPLPKSIPEVKVYHDNIAKNKVDNSGARGLDQFHSADNGDTSSGNLAKDESVLDDTSSKSDQFLLAIEFAEMCVRKGNYKRAAELIPEKERTARVYLLFIQLASKKTGMSLSLTLHPIAIEAYIQLLRLRTALPILVNRIPDCAEKPWMKSYLQGMDYIFRMKYKGNYGVHLLFGARLKQGRKLTLSLFMVVAGLADFQALHTKYPQNVDIKLRIAVCYLRLDKRTDCCRMFSQVRRIDPYVIEDMYHYGRALVGLEREQDVNELSQYLLRVNDKHPDTWCVLALYLETKDHKNRALQMVERALKLKPNHCGALLLKGSYYLRLSAQELDVPENLSREALRCFVRASTIENDPTTFKGLVESYIQLDRYSDALATCIELKELMPDFAQARAMYGRALYSFGKSDRQSIKDAFKEALWMDPTCLEASDGLCVVLEEERAYDEVLNLLDKQIDYNRVDDAYVKKARVYMKIGQLHEALLNYQKALIANPKNQSAQTGRTQIEKSMLPPASSAKVQSTGVE
ncbi:Anaphase-promoting complex subunit 7 [Podila humilis]|nr:Anaphase-promoting complex subunit 7 [Podila humilis]